MEWQGLPKNKVLRLLEQYTSYDKPYESGYVLGSMVSSPHPFAVEVYTRYIDRNLGDLGLSEGSLEIERNVINMLANLLNLEMGYGHIVSGGSEANILAIFAMKRYKKVRGRPEVIVSEARHISIDKAANLMDIKLVTIPLDDDYNLRIDLVDDYITDNTIGIVGIAGTTGLGLVDPIDKLAELTREHKLYLHVDAAFGGLVLPFMKLLGYKIPPFDFSIDEVMSITVDPHKMGMAPIPSGGIIFRKKSIIDSISFDVPYLAGGEVHQATITGTRPGAAVLATWALFKHLGIEGYLKIVKNALDLTHWFVSEIEKISDIVHLATRPLMNIVGVSPMSIDIDDFTYYLRSKGWAIGKFKDFIRIVIMPYVRKENLTRFLKDLNSLKNK